jgi:hypothetical protein
VARKKAVAVARHKTSKLVGMSQDPESDFRLWFVEPEGVSGSLFMSFCSRLNRALLSFCLGDRERVGRPHWPKKTHEALSLNLD